MSGYSPLQVGDALHPPPKVPLQGSVALPGLRGRDSQHSSATGPAALPSHFASHFMAHLPKFRNRHRLSTGRAHLFCIFRPKVPEWPVGRSPSLVTDAPRRLRASDPAPPPPILSPPLPPLPFPVSKSLVAHLQAARAPILSASSPFGVLRAESVSPILDAANHSRVFLSGEGSGGQTLTWAL